MIAGGIFELSKRSNIQLLLKLRLGNVVCELLASAFGTYVLLAVDVSCKVKEVVIFNPKKEVLILVILTWVFQIVILLNILVWYNAWPEHQGADEWERRFLWLGRWICCQCGREPAADEERQRSLRRIARWVTRLLGRADLTPSDTALSLILVATLQRQARRERIRRCVAEAAEGEGTRVEAVSLMERAQTIRALPISTSGRGSRELLQGPSSSSPVRGEVTEKDVLIDIQVEIAEEAVTLKQIDASLTAGATESSVAVGAAGDEEEALLHRHKSPEPGETGAAESLRDTGLEGPGRPLGKFLRQMALLREACITPSGMDEELRGSMSQEQATQLYTGGHWKVEAAVLSEVEHFSRFAAGVYGYGGERSSNWWVSMASALIGRETSEREERNLEVLNRADVNSLVERLYYENVIRELGDSSEIIYLSVANAALSHLPYLIALDHQSRRVPSLANPPTLRSRASCPGPPEQARSVVVALRGTTSVEDIITDSVAEPVRLEPDWLPGEIRARDGSGGHLYAHAGIKAAADAVLKDMEDNKVLGALLRGDYGDMSKSAAEEVMSKDAGEDAEARAQHYVAALMQRKLDCRDWRLVLTGHSLGAGAAALMALHLSGRFPNVHCWALSPPGGLMSTNLSRLVEPFVTSVIVGKDVVPRVSVVNLGRLIDQMVTSLALCKLNKSDAFLRGLTKRMRHEHTGDLFWRYAEVPEEAMQVLQAYNAGLEVRSRMLELVPPGRVIFLRPLKREGTRAAWDAVWVKAEEVIREGILVSPRMVEDHSCVALQAALRLALQPAGSDAPTAGAFGDYFPPVVPPAEQEDEAEDKSPV
ncbi:alpha/beta-hydrolase [Coccomyxa subellipsoidea C-169]|uniref:sn-1-specific diacylglycerol lipase n=1 Tax=Coccomyxa subellipsoidea (strain C-169) TaxID=574566 RepID=I0YPR8_COCSC|nr:alpha/beta-hydrolase [Coccomyxa subellipsoidea C-169]EIE20387.1 alpha/beta-hydrolase [Coccomyxa subellipsoidea C-169]|eukprot:XP_005644931.1 alpha/beta-hydrolase [Coccomyxa subellipsoidea C-169]